MNGTTPTHDSVCTVVVPCYNEEQRLPVSAFQAFIPTAPRIRFLFVNDGSTDGTLTILKALQTEFPVEVDVFDQKTNRGKAEAVRNGMLRALVEHHAPYTGFWDADLATPLSELPRLLGLMLTTPSLELVLGSRVRLQGRLVTRRVFRHYAGRIFATLASLTLSLPIYDTQCGAKLFRATPTLTQILATPFHSRWTFDVEMLARFLQIRRDNRAQAICALYEEPLHQWEDVGGSKLKIQDSFRAISDLLLIRRTYFE